MRFSGFRRWWYCCCFVYKSFHCTICYWFNHFVDIIRWLTTRANSGSKKGKNNFLSTIRLIAVFMQSNSLCCAFFFSVWFPFSVTFSLYLWPSAMFSPLSKMKTHKFKGLQQHCHSAKTFWWKLAVAKISENVKKTIFTGILFKTSSAVLWILNNVSFWNNKYNKNMQNR